MPKEKKLLIAAIVVFAVAVGAAIFYFVRATTAQKELASFKDNPNAAAEKETKDLIARVGELIVLPTDETPTIATVSDPEKLKAQSFFVNAKTGDKVLIYTKARKAILYDPIAHKIVEVAPLNIGDKP